MAQLRSDILQKRKYEDAENFEKQYKRIHIAEPIQIDEDEGENNEFTFNDSFNISDTEEEGSEDGNFSDINMTNDVGTVNSEQWIRMVENWIEMVNLDEDRLNNEDITGNETYDFEVGGHNVHPADNSLAKWKLVNLFNESLEAPICIGSMINLD
jgi:hypothetical protein